MLKLTCLLALAALPLAACDGAPDVDGQDPDVQEPISPLIPDGSAAPCDQDCMAERATVDAHPLASQLRASFARHYEQTRGTSYQALLAEHALPYVEAIGFDASQAEHHESFVSAFGLSNQAQDVLDELGFVVVPAPPRTPNPESPEDDTPPGPADVYYRIFAADLPVYVTADSILHAWHRSFGKLLEASERHLLSEALRRVLDKATTHLESDDTEAGRDALFYASVARALLGPGWKAPASVRPLVEGYLEVVSSQQMVKVAFLGQPTWIDFGQFQPRGHYTRSPELSSYFQAMKWLGGVDLVLHDAVEPRPREEAAARTLARAFAESGATAEYELIDRFYAGFVGQGNALSPKALLALCEQAGLPACAGDAAAMASLYAQQPAPAYSSRVFAGATPPVAMRFFPQRFAYDAWVTSQTTTPRLEGSEGPGGRAMAMAEDVAYALGNPRALAYMEDDMLEPRREHLPGTLEALRLTMDEVQPSALEDTAYTHWLEALRALGQPHLDESLPEVLRTAAWQDRKLEAVLASWAELRHDTVLMVEQSVGGQACQYPHGYVEPVPGLYRSLARSAAALAPLYEDLDVLPTGTTFVSLFKTVPEYLSYFQETMERLAVMAEKELAGEPLDAGDLAFLNQTVDRHADDPYFGSRQYDGWYPRLFWQLMTWSADQVTAIDEDHPSGVADPVVIDVHTDAEKGQVLEVGVGYPGLMVVALDVGDGAVLYGGPVSSFYAFHQPAESRMTDEVWSDMVSAAAVPERPAFARGYWVE